MSFQFMVYLGKKKKKRLFGFIWYGVFICFGIALLPTRDHRMSFSAAV